MRLFRTEEQEDKKEAASDTHSVAPQAPSEPSGTALNTAAFFAVKPIDLGQFLKPIDLGQQLTQPEPLPPEFKNSGCIVMSVPIDSRQPQHTHEQPGEKGFVLNMS